MPTIKRGKHIGKYVIKIDLVLSGLIHIHQLQLFLLIGIEPVVGDVYMHVLNLTDTAVLTGCGRNLI